MMQGARVAGVFAFINSDGGVTERARRNATQITSV